MAPMSVVFGVIPHLEPCAKLQRLVLLQFEGVGEIRSFLEHVSGECGHEFEISTWRHAGETDDFLLL